MFYRSDKGTIEINIYLLSALLQVMVVVMMSGTISYSHLTIEEAEAQREKGSDSVLVFRTAGFQGHILGCQNLNFRPQRYAISC